MNREQIIEMAKEAGIPEENISAIAVGMMCSGVDLLANFAALAFAAGAAAEREECARLENDPLIYTKHSLAAAIRARGQP